MSESNLLQTATKVAETELVPELNTEIEFNEKTLAIASKSRQLSFIALRRSFGTGIDAIAIGLVAMTPCLFRLFSQNSWIANPLGAIFGDGPTFFCFCLAFSPLPLIYLRIVFHKLLRTPTPGEMFAGATTITLVRGLIGTIQEIVYALFQYFGMAFSSVLAVMILTLVASSLGEEFKLFGLVLFLAGPVVSLIILSAAFQPGSESNASIFDDLSGLEVEILR